MKQSMGEFLATLRRANGYTQQEVAEKLGVSNRTLSSWETDRTAPDLLVLPAIADLYGVTVDEILRGERRAAEEKQKAISDDSKRNLKKRRFAKYGTRRLFCLGFALLGSLIFLAACAVLLYSSAPLWLSVLLMVIGAGGALACVILTACFAYSAIKAEGLVLKEDYTDEKKPYAFCVRRSAANSLFWLSLPHILGAIVFLAVYFGAGYYDYSVELIGVTVHFDYTTPTAVLVSLNIAFALAFFVSGVVLNLTGVFGLGTDGQKAAVKANGKLLGKIAGFSAIPVVIALVLMIVFLFVQPCVTDIIYFETDSKEEVYKIFQTYETSGIYQVEEDGTHTVIVPEGEYYLNFQSGDSVTLGTGKRPYEPFQVYDFESFYDLGNGFYGLANFERWQLYHLLPNVKAEDIERLGYYYDYLCFIGEFTIVYVPESGHNVTDEACNIAYDFVPQYFGEWVHPEIGEVWASYRFMRALNYKDGVYSYEEYCYYDYSLPFLIVFLCTAGGAVVADTVAYFIKRKRTEYSF